MNDIFKCLKNFKNFIFESLKDQNNQQAFLNLIMKH